MWFFNLISGIVAFIIAILVIVALFYFGFLMVGIWGISGLIVLLLILILLK